MASPRLNEAQAQQGLGLLFVGKDGTGGVIPNLPPPNTPLGQATLTGSMDQVSVVG